MRFPSGSWRGRTASYGLVSSSPTRSDRLLTAPAVLAPDFAASRTQNIAASSLFHCERSLWCRDHQILGFDHRPHQRALGGERCRVTNEECCDRRRGSTACPDHVPPPNSFERSG